MIGPNPDLTKFENNIFKNRIRIRPKRPDPDSKPCLYRFMGELQILILLFFLRGR